MAAGLGPLFRKRLVARAHSVSQQQQHHHHNQSRHESQFVSFCCRLTLKALFGQLVDALRTEQSQVSLGVCEVSPGLSRGL